MQIKLMGRDGAAEQIALHQVHAGLPHVVELLLGLDAFGCRHDAQPLGQRERRCDDGLVVAAREHALRERLVDLDLVEGKIGQMVR